MSEQSYCGCTEQMLEEFGRRRQQDRKWGKRHIRWHAPDRLPGVGQMAMMQAYSLAFSFWARVCGITFEQVRQHNLADIIILGRAIDGSSGTLAEAQLPPGDDRQLRAWFDVGERWTTETPPGNKIDLVAVACHEFGHSLGISHIKTPGNLMNPMYSPSIRSPQQGDIAEAVERYGKPKQQPKPEPSPDKPSQDAVKSILLETVGGELIGPIAVPNTPKI